MDARIVSTNIVKNLDLLKSEELPEWFQYPRDFLVIADKLQGELQDWTVLSGDDLRFWNNGLKERFPDRELVPMARSVCSDDIVCWDKVEPGKVVFVHDFASPGWETSRDSCSLEEWLSEEGIDPSSLAND